MVSLAVCFSATAQIDAQKAAAEAAKALEEAPKVEAPVAKPVYWDHSVMTQFNFGQSAFWNWAKGGNNNYAMTAYVDANANYTRDNISWKNRLQLDYGIMYSEDKPLIQKTKDRILLESTWGYKATKTLNYTASFTFLNQFSNPLPMYLGKDLSLSISSIRSMTLLTGLVEMMEFTIGANGLAALPIRSVLARILSRNSGISREYLLLAECMRSAIFTPEGQATSQRLQFMQYFKFSSKKYLSFRRSLSPSGPACFGPG